MKFNTYQKTAVTTVGATIFLIFVGGLVRATGAGLGCPDWPTCFGMWIPPTSAAQLPEGFDPAQFNVLKTWTEYLNRLVGVIIGLLITATAILSIRYRKSKPSIFYSSVAGFILVLAQGWLGGRVVETNLDVSLITIHMILAMVIMVTLLYAAFQSMESRWSITTSKKARKWLLGLGILLFGLTIVQLILGTEIREAVDQVKFSIPRNFWLEEIGNIDEFHRSFSWTILLSGVGLVILTLRKAQSTLLNKLSIGILAVIILQITLGAGLYYLGMPPAFQVLHLTGAAVLICIEFLYLLVIQNSAKALKTEKSASTSI